MLFEHQSLQYQFPIYDQIKEAFDNNKDVKAFYAVWNETSTGTMLNYLDKIKDLTSRNDSYYVLDGVSIVGGEELHMDKWGIDIAMTGAQKAFACPYPMSMNSFFHSFF